MTESIIACRVCGALAPMVNRMVILGKHDVGYFLCPNCDLLQTELPHWLDEAYEASISTQDTGLMHRNLMVSKRVAVFCRRHGLEKSAGLDFAGGYGILVRMLRDLGLDFYWSDKYSHNLVARGFEAEPGKHYSMVTAFEVLEHFEQPGLQLGKLFVEYDSDFFLFETTLRPERSVPESDWKYYAVDTGQHVAFYSRHTLAYVAAQHGRHYWSQGRLQVISKKPRPGLLPGVFKLPRALWMAYFPDAIPNIRRDQVVMEERARVSRSPSLTTDASSEKTAK